MKGEAESKSGCFSQENLENEVLIGKTECLRTMGVGQEQVRFFALSLFYLNKCYDWVPLWIWASLFHL